MTVLKLSEAKAHLGKYARQASKGGSFIITNHNQKLATLAPIKSKPTGVQPKIELMDGSIEIPEDFNTSLEAFETDFYER